MIHPRDFAIKAHGDQRYGNQPYVTHLNQVVDYYYEFASCIANPFSDEGEGYHIIAYIMETAAWLHDTLEDTEVTYEEIREQFGTDAANLVLAVTDEDGKNRKERKAKTLPKIRAYGYLAVAIKLCDRIANIQYCINSNNRGLMKMYKKEHASFKQALYREDDCLDAIWDHLDELIEWIAQ
jgi:(p)ppGpp synthase/HD superfamily hydrolase